MKLSRNVLVGSLATVGMVLGAVAPAVTAQAATTTGKFNNGTLEQVKSTDVGSLADADHKVQDPEALAIAYDKGDGATYGSATAESNANVTVVSGILTLDAVPDFGFGNAASGTTVSLKSNEATGDAQDGNDSGLLQVTDSRAAQADGAEGSTVKKGDTTGFSLQAQLGAFSTADAPQATDATLLQKFVMTLNPQELVDGTGESASTGATALKTDSAEITSDSKNATVMNPAAGSYKVGTVAATFNAANNGATLSVPAGLTKNDASNPSAQSYKSVITWTLNANPAAPTA